MLGLGFRATVLVGCGGFVLSACGPIEYIATVPLGAAGAIAEAKHVGGEKYAPYEMTAANEYVHKSRELAGYARFHSSVDFGRKAVDNAHKAKKLALEKAALPEEHATDPGLGTPPPPAAVEVAPAPAVQVVPAASPAPATSAPPATAPTPQPAGKAEASPSESPMPSEVTTVHTDKLPQPPPETPAR